MTYYEAAEKHAQDRILYLVDEIDGLQSITVRQMLEIQAVIQNAFDLGYRQGLSKLYEDKGISNI